MSAIVKIITVFLVCLAYSVIRYVVMGDVAVDHIPAYIINKATAFSSVVTLSLFIYATGINDKTGKFYWGKAFFHLTIIHSGLSLALMAPEYFKAFYIVETSTLTLWGELAVLTGVLGLYITVTCTQYQQALTRYRCYQGVLLLASLHLVFMGSGSWFAPEKWHGGLPPITLLSFIVVNIGLLISWRTHKRYAIEVAS